ncbi:MAG: aldo/keto reductase [Flavobacteriales bacterium]|nr:aldo/keto reductase [Flavobacteriales bacterium]
MQTPEATSENTAGLSRRGFVGMGMGLAAMALMPGALASNPGAAPVPQAGPAAPGRRRLGSLDVSAIGLGAMGMKNGAYHPPRRTEDMVPVIRGAVERGVNFIDTAEVYGSHTDEELVGEALRPVRDQVVIATKVGFAVEGNSWAYNKRNGRPEGIRRALEGSLRRLGMDHVDLLYLHRADPAVPIEDSVGAFKDLIAEGKIREYGLSEVAPATVRRAHAVHPMAALQSEYSLLERVPEAGTLQVCQQLGIGFVPYGPTARAYLADIFNEYSRFAASDRRSSVGFCSPEGLAANKPILDLVRAWGVRKQATPVQIALAWLLTQDPRIVPIPGTTKLHHLEENLGAAAITFTTEELAEFRKALEAIPVHGVRAPGSVEVDQ